MDSQPNIKDQFFAEREKLFNDEQLQADSYKFCVKHSLLVEEFILRLIQPKNFTCVLAAVGGFSRRELSPYSDIDLMFIFPELEDHDKEIQHCITTLWDAGIEVSHTVREFADIKKFLSEDLHAFTQFFETRFILGNKKSYDQWNEKLFIALEEFDKEKLIYEYFDDVEARYNKYGRSPKV